VVHTGRPIKRSGAHVKGHNKTTIGVAYVGGCDVDLNPKDTRTEKQKEAIINLIKDLKVKYTKINKVTGHNVYASKACPCFDAVTEYKDLV
jgi:N-acetylmuramoyl-L-alanine amidase